MLKRKFFDTLKEWKETKQNECLLVKGARQIGKTYIIRSFGKTNYKSYIEINFFEHPELKQIFEDSLEPKDIYSKMSLYILDAKFIKGDTLIFLDEIQHCPNARTALKFLAIDGSFDVIASGSLLGIQFKEESIPSIPVGYERQVEMFSLDFEEFLWALGINDDTIANFKRYFDTKQKVPTLMNEKMLEYLRQYIVIGGMPDVVNTYLATKDYQQVQSTQNKILATYEDDIAQYSNNYAKPKIKKCYYSIPKQLAKENKKFQFSVVEKNATARRFENSIDWLVSAKLATCCYNVSTPQFPLLVYEKTDQFKLYVNDVGLLCAMYGFEMKREILNNTLVGFAKGGIYENLIFDMLIKRGIRPHYYKTENSTQEIEFIISQNGSVIPIEVKSKNGATLSLNNFITNFAPPYAYKFISGNIGVDGVKITLPLYMAMFI